MRRSLLGSAVALAALALFALAPAARAQTTTYTTQDAFLANVAPGFYLETFDSLTKGAILDSPLTFSSGGFSYTASVDGTFFNVGPDSDVWLSTEAGPPPIVITFTSGNVTAVGGLFFITDINGFPNGGNIIVTLNDGTVLTLNGTSPSTFGGFTSTVPILSLTVQRNSTSNQNYSTVNNLIVGTATVSTDPDPADPINDLISQVESYPLPKGIKNSFVVKLEAALSALEAGDDASACDSLQAFINHAKAQRGKKLPVEPVDLAQQLIDAAEAIREQLGCS